MTGITAPGLAVIVSIGAAAPALAASPFDGLWVADLDTQAGQAGFDSYLVAGGRYRCDSCRPPRDYPADGRLRPIAGDSSIQAESAQIVGPRRLKTRIVSAMMTRQTMMTVAADGQSATYVSLDSWPCKAAPLRTEYLARRVKPGPAGAHPVSGSWLGLRYVAVPEAYRSVRLHEAGGAFTRVDFRHGSYTAVIGGGAAPVTGDGKNIFTATVTAPAANIRIETIRKGDKPLVERTYALSADGSALVTTVRDPSDGAVYISTSRRGATTPSR